MNADLHNRLADDAYSACRADFAREKQRPMDHEESAVANRAAYLAVEWASQQHVDAFAPETLASKARRLVDRRAERRRRRANRFEERQRVRECKRYIEDNWHSLDGVGFLFSLISAVIWHLIVILIVRWLIIKFFSEPGLAETFCRGE